MQMRSRKRRLCSTAPTASRQCALRHAPASCLADDLIGHKSQMWNFVDGSAPGGFCNAPGASSWRTFPQYFKEAGYYTAGVGKLFHPGDPAEFDPPSWSEARCVPGARNPGVQGGFPYYGQGKCPYVSMLMHTITPASSASFSSVFLMRLRQNNLSGSLVPPPGWGCPVDRQQYP
jgi:hypothetical protein